MTPENMSLHVLRMSGRWVIEKGDGTTVGEAENQEEAIALARDSAQREGASEIAIHGEDGQIEKTLTVEDKP